VAALGVPYTCSGLAGATGDAASYRLDGVDEVVHAGAAPEVLGVELAAADALGVLDAVLAAASSTRRRTRCRPAPAAHHATPTSLARRRSHHG
jgi:hypothetical protein